MNLAQNALDGSQLPLDPVADVNETTAIVHHATRNGVIILGGGSPKNFYLQTQPQLWEGLGINKGGPDYFIQITTESLSLSGLILPHDTASDGVAPERAPQRGAACAVCME